MSVAVEKPVSALGHRPGKDVDQMKAFALAYEIDGEGRVETEIVVAQYDGETGIDFAQRIEDRFLAHIAQMPDFIDVLKKLFDLRHPAIMSVGDDPDAVCFLFHHKAQA